MGAKKLTYYNKTNDYYPFGMLLPNTNTQTTTDPITGLPITTVLADEALVGIGSGTGISVVPNDHDNDTTPDYQDSDSDNDGEDDILEGHDLDGTGVIDNGGASNGTSDPLTDGTFADADTPDIHYSILRKKLKKITN